MKTVEATSTTTLMMPQGAVKTETTTYIEYPDRFRVEARVVSGTVVQVYAGEKQVWVQDPIKGLMDVPAQVRKDFKAGVDRDVIPLLVRTARGELKPRLVDQGADQQVRAVEVSGAGIEPVTLYIDAASGLVLRESYRLPDRSGSAEELFADYRDVEGLKIAFRATVRRNGLPVLERLVTEFKVNPPLKAGLFEKPSAPSGKPPSAGQAGAMKPPAAATATPKDGALPQRQAPPPDDARPPVATTPRTVEGGPKPPAGGSEPDAIALIHKAIEAKGGLARLKGVRSMQITAANVMITPQGKPKADSVTYIQYPDRFRVDIRQSGHTATGMVVGDELTVRTPDGVVGSPAIGSEADRSFRGSVQREVILLLLRAGSGELRARMVPQDPSLQGASPERLVELSGKLLDPVVVGIDAATGMVRRLSYPTPGDPKGPWLDEIYSDYRDVDGIKISYRSDTRLSGTVIREHAVKEVVINGPMASSLFDKALLK